MTATATTDSSTVMSALNLGVTVKQKVAPGEAPNHDRVRAWNVQDAIVAEDGDWRLVLTTGSRRMIVRESDMLEQLRTDGTPWEIYWPQHRPFVDFSDDPVAESPLPPLECRVIPKNPRELIWTRESGRGSRTRVNEFLESDVVNHRLGGVQFWSAAFSARSPFDDSIVAAVVLHKPASRNLDDWTGRGPQNGGTGTRLEVSRLAAHVARPKNTSSWILSQAAEWATEQGFEIIQAYTGVNDNRGDSYRAAGWHPAASSEIKKGDAGWNASDGRDGRVDTASDDGWTRVRWELDLECGA